MNARSHQGRSEGAFTLIELLVSTAITLIILSILMYVFAGFLDLWGSTSARSETFAEARAALGLMAHELDQVIPKVGDTVTVTSTPGLGVTPAKSLGFLCKASPADQPSGQNQSDVCAVIYFLSPTNEGGVTGQALYRRLITSQTVYDRLKLGSALYTDATDRTSPYTEMVAQNVVDFQVTLRDASYSVIPPSSDPTQPAGAPCQVEVLLTVISSRGATQYFDPTVSDAQKQKLAAKESRNFTMRHHL